MLENNLNMMLLAIHQAKKPADETLAPAAPKILRLTAENVLQAATQNLNFDEVLNSENDFQQADAATRAFIGVATRFKLVMELDAKKVFDWMTTDEEAVSQIQMDLQRLQTAEDHFAESP
jgi:hypothetical protein